MSGDSVAKGNAFRDTVASMLEAAGFAAKSEIRKDFKKIDVLWERRDIDGAVKYAVEAKAYTGTLNKAQCIEFVTEYGSLVEGRTVDKAWLISLGDISPDGRALIDSARGLSAFTYAEFQRRIIGLDSYLQAMIASYDLSGTEKWYVPLFTPDDEDIEKIIRGWIVDDNALQLAIIAGYGKGKSTFAQKMSAQLAKEAVGDASRRVPILIALGDILEEQSLEGLLGKTFSINAAVYGYNFGLFMRLNEAGRFVIFLDGFDEMKHGMTVSKFGLVFKELMRLDRGLAKLVVLGRNTAFHDEPEFRAIIEGRQTTRSGQELRIEDRRELRTLNIREFSIDEAKRFVAAYFPAMASEAYKSDAPTVDWVAARRNELLSGLFDDLLIRPVHARMLCQIATDKSVVLGKLSKYGLFDRFVHFLLDREITKKARDPRFGLEVRRKFNAAVALWLWRNGSASTVSLASLPMALCHEAAAGVAHDYDDFALRRELTQGCLIDKGQDTFYFSHRSLQEFLVAEALIDRSCEAAFDKSDLRECLHVITPEISEFLIEGCRTSSFVRAALSKWIPALAGMEDGGLPEVALTTLAAIAEVGEIRLPALSVSPWYGWVAYRQIPSNSRAASSVVELIASLFRQSHSLTVEHQAVVLNIFRAFTLTPDGTNLNNILPLIAAWLNPDDLSGIIDDHLGNSARPPKSKLTYIDKNTNFLLWTLLKCSRVTKMQDGFIHLQIDLSAAEQISLMESRCRMEKKANEGLNNISFSVQALYRLWGIDGRRLETIRRYFYEAEIYNNILPIEYVLKERPFTTGTEVRKTSRPILSLNKPARGTD